MRHFESLGVFCAVQSVADLTKQVPPLQGRQLPVLAEFFYVAELAHQNIKATESLTEVHHGQEGVGLESIIALEVVV